MTAAVSSSARQRRTDDTTGGRGSADRVGAVTVAAIVVVTFEAWRLLFPHVYALKERAGLVTTAAVALGAAAAGLAAPAARRLGGPRAIGGALVALGLWRTVCVVVDPVPVAMAVAGTALAAIVVVLVLAAPPAAARTGLVAGLLADLTLSAAFGTWDPIWQHTPASTLVGLALAATLGACGRRAAVRSWAAHPLGAGAAALGAVALLQVLLLANPAYLAGGGLGLPVAASVVALGIGALAAGARLRSIVGGPAVPGAAVLLAAGGYAITVTHGLTTAVLVVAVQAAAGVVADAALAPVASARRLRTELALGAALVVPVAGTLLFQLHYDAPLPVDNRVLVVAAGLAGVLAARARPATRPTVAAPVPRRLTRRAVGVTAVTAAALAVPLAMQATAPGAPERPPVAAPSWRVVQWNVHQAVTGDGSLDPDAVADAIEAQGDVDVVVLNEVGRGWPLSGQLDLATWLSRRLDMRVAWAGAASDQFGNLVLSGLPIDSVDVTTLPTADGSQGRSALHVTLATGGAPIEVVATHLQHHNDTASMDVRLAEIRLLVDRWAGRDVVLAGDLNPRQGDPPAYPVRRPDTFAEIRLLLDAGFTTAADLASCDVPTSNRNCSDYVFVAGALEASSHAVIDTDTGDHRLLVTDIVRR